MTTTSPEALREATSRLTEFESLSVETGAGYALLHVYGNEEDGPPAVFGLSADLKAVLSALQEARADAVAFCAPWAAVMARNHGLPDGHLFPEHYDILERNGARMVAFTRHDPDRAISHGGEDE